MYDPDDLRQWKVYFHGPLRTPYEKGIFQASLVFPARFPLAPPGIRFHTEILHPNIAYDGRLSLASLCNNRLYSPKNTSISSILTEICWLLIDPDLTTPLYLEAAFLFEHNRSLFERKAAAWTEQYAVVHEGNVRLVHPVVELDDDFVSFSMGLSVSSNTESSNYRHILHELETLRNGATPDISIEPYYPNDLQKWKVYLHGSCGTPYEGGTF